MPSFATKILVAEYTILVAKTYLRPKNGCHKLATLCLSRNLFRDQSLNSSLIMIFYDQNTSSQINSSFVDCYILRLLNWSMISFLRPITIGRGFHVSETKFSYRKIMFSTMNNVWSYINYFQGKVIHSL